MNTRTSSKRAVTSTKQESPEPSRKRSRKDDTDFDVIEIKSSEHEDIGLQPSSAEPSSFEDGSSTPPESSAHSDEDHFNGSIKLVQDRKALTEGVEDPVAAKILRLPIVQGEIPCPALACEKKYRNHSNYLRHIIDKHPGELEHAATKLLLKHNASIKSLFVMVGDKTAIETRAVRRKKAQATSQVPEPAGLSPSLLNANNNVAASQATRSLLLSNAAIIESNRCIYDAIRGGSYVPWEERPILRLWDKTASKLKERRALEEGIAGSVAVGASSAASGSSHTHSHAQTTDSSRDPDNVHSIRQFLTSHKSKSRKGKEKDHQRS